METKGLFQLEIIINVLIIIFCFMWIPMLWVYGQYNLFFRAEIDFRRQILTFNVNPHAESVQPPINLSWRFV